MERKEQEENTSSETPSTLPNYTPALLNFSRLTPSQFGISAQSFTPSATPKDKSRVAQLRSRRKSSIGVRGSPETNSLIRFMAQQKLVKNRSNQLRVASTLKQKMASFQNLMDAEESQTCVLMPRQDSGSGGCVRTGDDLSDWDSHNQKMEQDKENYPSGVTLASFKRRRLEQSESCHFEMTDTKVPVLSWSLEVGGQEEPEKPVTQSEPPSCEGADTAQAELTPPALPLPFDLQFSSPPDNQQGSVFDRSVQLSPGTSAPALHPTPSINIPPPSAQLDTKPAVKKKKSVHFGTPLSPEFFDKTLPPSTPLRKGATPARTPTPGGGLNLRSVLKTPQMSDSERQKSGADACSPSMFGASPTLIMLGSHRRKSQVADSEEEGMIVFPSTEEIDSEALDAEYMLDAQPLNLNAAFNEESLSETQTEFEPDPGTVSLMDELEPEPEPEATVESPVQRRNRRKKRPAPEWDSDSEAPSESSSRKREQSVEVRPVKRSSRSAARLACGKMKTSAGTRKWNKEVDRSLYSSRAYASKNPTLSPIKERRSFIIQPPAAESESASCTDDETNLNLKMTADSQTMSEPAATEEPSEDSDVCYRCGPEIAMGTDNKQAELKEKSSVAIDVQFNAVTAGEMKDEHCEDQTTENPEAPWEPTPTHMVPEHRAVDPSLDQAPVETCSSNSDKTLEGPVALGAVSSPRAPSAESSDNERQRKVKRGRRSSANSLQQHTDAVCDAADMDQTDQQHTLPSSSESRDEGGAAGVDLAPWQADFNLEDVFKPLATRGQRSVRRSLRNQSSTAQSTAGLAWLPWTSPDNVREVRRKTRGRRLSAAPPSLSEETL